jgi:hypothetical protein
MLVPTKPGGGDGFLAVASVFIFPVVSQTRQTDPTVRSDLRWFALSWLAWQPGKPGTGPGQR